MLAPRINRLFLFALVAVCSLCFSNKTSLAGDCSSCQQACVECPPNACDCPCYCTAPRPNYVYKALDAVAGGIEKLLGLDKLNCDSCCDAGGCQDCCDAIIPDSTPIHSTPIHSTPIHSTPVPSAPIYREQSPPASIVPYLDSYSPDDHSHVPAESGQWIGQPQSPGSNLQIDEPAIIQPEVIEPQFIEPQAIEPRVIDPPIHRQEELTNPFKDDA